MVPTSLRVSFDNSLQGPTTPGPTSSLISSLPTYPPDGLHGSHMALVLAARHVPTSGPLQRLFPLPGMLFPRRPHDPLLPSFRSLLKCLLLGQVFLEHPL